MIGILVPPEEDRPRGHVPRPSRCAMGLMLVGFLSALNLAATAAILAVLLQ